MNIIDKEIIMFRENVEYWKELNLDFIIKGRYLVSSFGKIFDKKINRCLNGYKSKDGYVRVHLHNEQDISKSYLLHRIICLSFIDQENLEKTQVNHKNYDRSYNNVVNLEWTTPLENTQHAMQGLNYNRGENVSNAKFTDKQVESICKMIQDGYKYKDILIHLGMDTSVRNNYDLIGFIRRGISYKHISSKYDFSNRNIYNGNNKECIIS